MISLIVLSLILMLLRYRPIDHVSHIIGQARARLPCAFLQKRLGPSSFVLIGPSPSGETDKDIGGEKGRKLRVMCQPHINIGLFYTVLLAEL